MSNSATLYSIHLAIRRKNPLHLYEDYELQPSKQVELMMAFQLVEVVEYLCSTSVQVVKEARNNLRYFS